MKKVILMVSLLTGISLASCNKEDTVHVIGRLELKNNCTFKFLSSRCDRTDFPHFY